ncbi:MAG: hypothetical protein LBJ89_04960 [Holosporales bacterium]|jgi:predicted transposase YbfD/YdcC|nr:hypothetical protein [Holosporales bacterium]
MIGIAYIALLSDKNTEVAAFRTLLQELDLHDIIVTVDVIQCKKNFELAETVGAILSESPRAGAAVMRIVYSRNLNTRLPIIC